MLTTGSTLFRQTLFVLVGGLILSGIANFLAFVLLPPFDARVTTLSGIASQLANPVCDEVVPAVAQTRGLSLISASDAPTVPSNMQTDALLQLQLAQVLGVPESSVRLAWIADSDFRLNQFKEVKAGGRTGRLQETLLLGEFLFARKWPDYWCVGHVVPPLWSGSLKTRSMLGLALSLAALLPFAWLSARRLSRPMHDFADAADAIGRDAQAPLLEELGPKEMRTAAKAMNAMQARIHEQSREREAMIAAIAHDLRTPLSRIAFRVEATSPSVSEHVQRDIDQMKAMITATLDFCKDGAHVKGDQLIDLGALLQFMVEDEQAVGHDVKLISETDAIYVEGDELQFSRLFQNIIDNARNYGGAAEIRLRQHDGKAIVTVADRGPGIHPGQVEEMFRPFTRGEPSRNSQTGGIGLGLSITRAIARRHGGEITLSNRAEGGLEVTISFPVTTL